MSVIPYYYLIFSLIDLVVYEMLMPCVSPFTSDLAVKSRLVLPFWYQLTRVVPEKGPCVWCVCVCACVRACVKLLYMHISVLHFHICWL